MSLNSIGSVFYRNIKNDYIFKKLLINLFGKNQSKRMFSEFITPKAYINGQWVNSTSGKTFDVLNPANGEVIGQSADCGAIDAENAIKAANNAFQSWQNTTAKTRSQLLYRLFELQTERANDLAELLTREMGKPLKESVGEINYGAGFLQWFAEEARRINGGILQSPWQDKMMMYLKEPIGPVGIITPVRLHYIFI